MSQIIRRYNNKIFIFLLIIMMIASLVNISTIADGPLLPDLDPVYLSYPDSPWKNGEEIEIIFTIENIGTKNISTGEIIEVGLFLDYDPTPVASNSTNKGLDIGNSTYVNISWTPTIADGKTHVFDIYVNYNYQIQESSYSNNFESFQVTLSEKDTDLEIIDIYIPDSIIENESANIITTITNYGADTSEDIYATLKSSEDGKIATIIKENGLDNEDTHVFSFNWTPSHFGSQTLTIDIGIDDKSHDLEEVSVEVGVGQLDWWNENWHYRYFLTVNGTGNAVFNFNFTELLETLNVFSEIFEDDTIRIINYSNDGRVIGEVTVYKFNESSDYNSINNATGSLIWNVSENSNEKYFCIYFDVVSNLGSRTPIIETDTLKKQGTASVNPGFVDGWQVNIQEPVDGGYTLVINPINLSIITDAKAESVSAFIFLNENLSHNFTLNLVDNADQTEWIYNNFYFGSEGNWTIRVSSVDNAGYKPPIVNYAFLVGKPDLELVNFTISTDWAPDLTIYKGNTIEIITNVVSHDATIKDVNITVQIINMSNDEEIFLDYIITTLIKDEIKQFNFKWTANNSGKYNIFVKVDPLDEIDESDETNNRANLAITIHEWPDLKVQDIIIPTETIMEYEQVKIDTIIENNGLGNATDYVAKLYLERAPTDGLRIMKYENEIDNVTFNLTANSSKTISFYWDSAQAGIWLVGVKIYVEEGQRDANYLDNHMLSDTNLVIRSYERNRPKISNVEIDPTIQEQGGSIIITANITDDSGLESVIINITNPFFDSFDSIMIRSHDDIFKYVFDQTYEVGFYEFTIEAVDISVHKNIGFYYGNFTIIEDQTDPIISYHNVYPYVQLIDKSVTISCLANDNIMISTVQVTITTPKNVEYTRLMDMLTYEKYEFTDTYDTGGKYTYKILVKDVAGNWDETEKGIFWITRNLNDTDNDGMPDEWEKRYNLDHLDPDDANEDTDGDGYSNLKEYQIGTNPEKDIFLQNVAYRIKENAWYLVGSVILFVIIFILALYGIRRKKI